MTLGVARFVFQGPMPQESARREAYAIEAGLARRTAADAPHGDAARLRAYAAAMERTYDRLGWVPERLASPVVEAMLQQARARVRKVYPEWRGRI